MSLLTHAFLFERYGARLTIEQLAEVLHFAPTTIYNQVAVGTFGVRTYIDGKRRFADARDVADYLDECRARAS